MENKKEWPPLPSVLDEATHKLAPMHLRNYGYQLRPGMEYRLYSLTEVRRMIEDGRVVPLKKRPKKRRKIPSQETSKMTPSAREHTEGLLQDSHLLVAVEEIREMVAENRWLQLALKDRELVISWDEEKKETIVVTKPRRSAAAGKRKK